LHRYYKGSAKTTYPNPQFVEAMMGYPDTWTDLNASETP
jgi:hypothetical protein